MRNVVLLVLLAACGSREVTVRGRVEHARGRPDQYWPLVGGTVRIIDTSGAVYSSGTTDSDGRFSAQAPAPAQIFAEVAGDGIATSSFTGVTGDSRAGDLVLRLDENQDTALYGVLLTDIDDLEARYAGCPGVGSGGGIVFGEVRVVGILDPITDEEPLVGTAEVSVATDEESGTLPGCFLDEAGAAFDPDATVTGRSGQFAVFGVPSGRWQLVVQYAALVDSQVITTTDIWVPDADVAVVPRLPAWVEFPF